MLASLHFATLACSIHQLAHSFCSPPCHRVENHENHTVNAIRGRITFVVVTKNTPEVCVQLTENMAGYTATSCGQVGKGGNASFPTFRLNHYGPMDGPTDGPMDGRTD